jgi:hypothetical protein
MILCSLEHTRTLQGSGRTSQYENHQITSWHIYTTSTCGSLQVAVWQISFNYFISIQNMWRLQLLTLLNYQVALRAFTRNLFTINKTSIDCQVHITHCSPLSTKLHLFTSFRSFDCLEILITEMCSWSNSIPTKF